MSNFIVVSSSDDRSAERVFSAGLLATRRIKSQTPSSLMRAAGSRGATFARKNGSGTRAVKDAVSGCWLIATGTWLHDAGFATGSEAKLLDRWLEVGARCVARELEGLFTVVVCDPRAREMVVVTDLAATSTTFFRTFTDAVAVSGSSAVLAALGPSTTDALACQELLRSGNVYESRTTWNEVRRADGASIYRFRDGSLVSQERYWSPADVSSGSLDGNEAADALHAALTRVARRIRSVYPDVVCDLTGGFDSRAVVSAFLSARVPFRTTVAGTRDSSDVVVAGRIASKLGLSHEHVPPRGHRSFEDVAAAATLADFEYDPVEYSHIHAVHAHLARRHDASVNGTSGELARDTIWENLSDPAGRAGTWDSGKLRRRRYADSGCNSALFPAASRYDVFGHFDPIIARAVEGISALPNTTQIDWVYVSVRIHAWQARIASSTDQLWPCMSPFMFRSVLETCMRMTTRSRLRSRVVRNMLYRHQPQLAGIPLTRGFPPLPLRADTAHRLAGPVAVSFAKKAWKKARRTLTGDPWAPPVTVGGIAPRVHLWMEQVVHDLLDPREMRTGALFDAGTLEGFLRASQSRDFRFTEQWNRLLGLEYGRRVVETARAEIAARDAAAASEGPRLEVV